jgi:hypothetical protein
MMRSSVALTCSAWVGGDWERATNCCSALSLNQFRHAARQSSFAPFLAERDQFFMRSASERARCRGRPAATASSSHSSGMIQSAGSLLARFGAEGDALALSSFFPVISFLEELSSTRASRTVTLPLRFGNVTPSFCLSRHLWTRCRTVAFLASASATRPAFCSSIISSTEPICSMVRPIAARRLNVSALIPDAPPAHRAHETVWP